MNKQIKAKPDAKKPLVTKVDKPKVQSNDGAKVSTSLIDANTAAAMKKTYRGFDDRPSEGFRRNRGEFYKRDQLYSFTKVLLTKRVDKVVAGGRNTSFVAIIVVGNWKDRMGIGVAKSRTMVDAIQSAKESAEKNVIIPGNIQYAKFKHCATTLIIKKRKDNITRSVSYLSNIFMACGWRNVSCKIVGSNNAVNVITTLVKYMKFNIQRRTCLKILHENIQWLKNNQVENKEINNGK